MIKQVLLVDDDEEVLALLAVTLEQAGYRTVQAESAARALKLLAAERYPVIVSDISMPDMDGLQLLQRVKEIDETVRVIMVTAYPTIDSAITALNNGAASFLKKPFEPPELVGKVNDAFEKFSKEYETRKLIDELRYAREYDEQIIKNLIYTVIVLDPRGNIKKINNAMESLLGYREDEVVGRPASLIFSGDFRRTAWEDMLKEKKVVDLPVTFLTKRGKEILAAFTGMLMKDAEGTIIGFIGTTKNLGAGQE